LDEERKQMKKLLLTLFTVFLFTFTLSAQSTVYNNIPNPLPGNVPSEGPEAYFFAELGAGVEIQTPAVGATMHKASVVMSSWVCQQGNWQGGCITEQNATFDQPITVNIYSANGDLPVALLGSVTDTFKIPYRPSADPTMCPSATTKWYSKTDNKCYNGLASVVTFNLFDLTPLRITLPTKIIVTVAYNTTDAGPHPLGVLPCRNTPRMHSSRDMKARGSEKATAAPARRNEVNGHAA
jgi:hypothetical protein